MQEKSESKLQKAEYIAGIGASAGGLEALQEFFKSMPEKTGIGFVVIQHLSPDYKSLMDELLARYTSLRIVKVEHGMYVEPDTIYLIPPRKNMRLLDGKLMLEDQGSREGILLPIDIFFRSLAAEAGKKAVGVILSGTGSDGTLGTRALKEAGGMVMVQDQYTAKFDGMPRNSIATGVVDFILPPGDMAEAIINYIQHPILNPLLQTSAILSQNDTESLNRVIAILKSHCGIDFSYYKENTIIRRLERRLNINRIETLEEYIAFLNDSNKEREILHRELLIGVTRFFRDEEAFRLLNEKIIPKLPDKDQTELRIWSVGCSTGEEVYSIAMLLKEYIDQWHPGLEIKIFATDIDKQSIAYAGKAYYPDSIVSDVDRRLLSKYFIKRENGYQVGETIRKMVVFATHNILKDPPFSKIDMVVCRNLFIYFKPESQAYVLNLFRLSIKPKGILFMGSSESLGAYTDAFNIISNKHKFFEKKEVFNTALENRLPARSNYPVGDLRYQKYATQNRLQHNDKLLNNLAETILPPSVLIDEGLHIIRIINDINPYVELKTGRFNQNLSNIIPADLNAIITNILRRLRSGKSVARFNKVKLLKDGKARKISLEGRTISDTDNTIFLISFIDDQEEINQEDASEPIGEEEQTKNQISELQYELQYTKESLQAVVEELETANEELQASNEELMASNEELQSTNEELQSVNEELHTVNYEHQLKIEELTVLNDDINNLVKNIEVAALYLDNHLNIRKFTPALGDLCKLMDYDVGRPLGDLAKANIYSGFMADIERVRDDLKTIEKEIILLDETAHYLLRIAPYRTDYNAVDGIIVTLVSIAALQEEREKSTQAAIRLHNAMESGDMAWWEWDIPSGEVAMHEKKATMLGYTLEEFPNNVYEICKLIHPDDYEHAMQQMRDHIEGKAPSYKVVYRLRTKSGDYKKYYDKGGVVSRDKKGKPLKLAGIVIDIDGIED